MNDQKVRKVVIAGGGTAGWCVATALAKMLGPLLDITLVESEEIGIVGVGEATVPTIRRFHGLCGIDERTFMRATNGSIKMAILFKNWARQGDSYIHSFGVLGKATWMAPFHQVWLQARADGYGGNLSDYCLEHQAAAAGKFETSENGRLNYAYHFDTNRYGPFLRQHCGDRVTRIEGKIVGVDQDADTGNITQLVLQSGQTVAGDLFIDCTGFRGLLIEQTLKTGYEDWNHWLANDSAWATQAPTVHPIMPYTGATAHDAGWIWDIPLQTRVGKGFVFSSRYMTDDVARQQFLDHIGVPPLAEPNLLKFRTGRRLKIWNKNCIAFGLASGFIEPLESTNIHLMQTAATRLVQLFPFSGITPSVARHFNTLTRDEVANVRDFVIMHYKLTEREDTAYWRDRRDLEVPDSLAERLELFREHGHAYQLPDEVFRVDSWLQVMLGQRFYPDGRHHLGRMTDRKVLEQALANMKAAVDHEVERMPAHEDFIREYCA